MIFMSIETYYLQYALPGSQDTCSNENVIFNKVGLSTNLPIFFGGKLSLSGEKFKIFLFKFLYIFI